MRFRHLALLSLAGFFAVLIALPVKGKNPEIKVGERVANLTFKDIRYLPRSLDDFPRRKAFVIAFTNTSCPLVQRYWPALRKLDTQYRSKDVQVLAVNVGAEDSIVAIAAQAVQYEAEFPFVKDFDGSCVQALGVARTPEVVILDDQRRIRYRGRIDDQYRLGGVRATATRQDLQEALEDVLAGREVRVKETTVDGCLITRPETRLPGNPVTYADHVAPLLQKHCQECHKPNTTAPFSLLSYKDAATRADMIAEVVADQRMPPWFAGPEHNEFINRRGLTAEERNLILAWVRAGKPPGDESKLPPTVAKADPGGWKIGAPDLVLKAPEHNLPAAGDIPYKYELLPYMFLDDTWVQGVQILPDNPKVLHHCNMAYVRLGEKFSTENFITGTVPGAEPMTLKDNVGFLIPKGAMLVLQIHYVSTGKPEKCRISVGFKYASEIIKNRLHFILVDDHRFAIPPGAPAHKVARSRIIPHDAVGVALFTHMHVRGRDMTFIAHRPDGTAEKLLLIPNYNFDWQMPYRWAPGQKRFPKGTRLEVVAHYDNSAFNPYNPDPTVTVREGPQTYHEMMNGFFFYTAENENLNLEVDPKTGRAKKPPEPKGK